MVSIRLNGKLLILCTYQSQKHDGSRYTFDQSPRKWLVLIGKRVSHSKILAFS